MGCSYSTPNQIKEITKDTCEKSITNSATNKRLHTVIEDTNNVSEMITASYHSNVCSEGDPLTMPDLVVILIALNPSYAEHLMSILRINTLSAE